MKTNDTHDNRTLHDSHPPDDDEWPEDNPVLALERQQRLKRILALGLLLTILCLIMLGPAVLDSISKRRATKPSRELAKESREAIAKGDRVLHDQALREADAKVKAGRLGEAKTILLKQLPLDVADAAISLRISEIWLRQGEPRVAYNSLKSASDRWPKIWRFSRGWGRFSSWITTIGRHGESRHGSASGTSLSREALLLESQIAFGEGHLGRRSKRLSRRRSGRSIRCR